MCSAVYIHGHIFYTMGDRERNNNKWFRKAKKWGYKIKTPIPPIFDPWAKLIADEHTFPPLEEREYEVIRVA